MADTILDKNPGSREYIAQAHLFGATRAAICTGLAAKLGITAPTTRSMTTYLNQDPELKRMIRDLAAIRDEMSPDDPTLPELPEPLNIAQIDEDFLSLCDEHPAFAELLFRGADGDYTAPENKWGVPVSAVPGHTDDAPLDPDVLDALEADDIEAASLGHLPDDWDAVEPIPAAGLLGPPV